MAAEGGIQEAVFVFVVLEPCQRFIRGHQLEDLFLRGAVAVSQVRVPSDGEQTMALGSHMESFTLHASSKSDLSAALGNSFIRLMNILYFQCKY